MLLSGRGSRAAIAVTAFAISLLAAWPLASRAGAVTYEAEPGFCFEHTVANPKSPFLQMPELHQPSHNGRIGFGPSALRLIPTPSLRVDDGKVGFTLGVSQRRGLSLPWTATSTIVEVNTKGRPIGKARRTTGTVGWLNPRTGKRFQFAVSDELAFYRSTLLLTGASGQRLGKFSFYTKVAKAHPEARLNLNASSYRPENTVFMRVENLGNLTAFYGVGYEVEKLEGNTWVEAPENPHGPVIAIGITALPGYEGPCDQFWIPSATAPGTYRIAKEVSFVFPYVPGQKGKKITRRRLPKATLTAEFQVLP